MKQQELQKPLIQSALVLLAIIVLIGFVAGSGTTGIFGGVVSIFKGLFYSILFAIALVIALVISVLFMVAIFFGGVALYSPDTAKELYHRFKNRLSVLWASWAGGDVKSSFTKSVPKDIVDNNDTGDIEIHSEKESVEVRPDKFAAIDERVSDIERSIADELSTIATNFKTLQEEQYHTGNTLKQLKESLEKNPSDEIFRQIDDLNKLHNSLAEESKTKYQNLDKIASSVTEACENTDKHSARLDHLESQLASFSDKFVQLEKTLSETISQSHPSPVSTDESEYEEYRIFSYIENKEDQDKFAALATEAVKKDLSFSEIDSYLSAELPKDLDTIVKDHPSLTKDYIRVLRKNN